MQYVRSFSGSVSKTWNSINPATLSGAIDVIVVELEDGTLACSPFHVRFGKFSLLRPSEKKVEFKVNDVKQDYAMKLGDGGEAFFVFESNADIPEDLQTSPLLTPASSPRTRPSTPGTSQGLDSEPLDLTTNGLERNELHSYGASSHDHSTISGLDLQGTNQWSKNSSNTRPRPLVLTGSTAGRSKADHAFTDDILPTISTDLVDNSGNPEAKAFVMSEKKNIPQLTMTTAEPSSAREDITRAINLSKKLWSSNIPTQVTDKGNLMLDMTGYKSDEDEALKAEVIARRILSEELEGDRDIGSLIGADENGNLWIYSSEEAKFEAGRKAAMNHMGIRNVPADAVSDPGYQSDDSHSITSDTPTMGLKRKDSDSGISLTTPGDSPDTRDTEGSKRYYAKTLRLTNEQLKALNLKSGANPMSFSVNRATCHAFMYYWQSNAPIVISDIDGTITKSDALGHVLNMFGRDWTHQGVAKLYSDIVANGYNILYLTSRSVGQADTTRTYLTGVVQDGYKLPKGPVIMSPDRTMAALRREVYLRKPEVFKMACLRDILSLFSTGKSNPLFTPFYAGFGNRLTDALSYRSVNIPSTRIFTINSEAEVSLDLLSLNGYKTGYVSMRELVDYYFPPTALLVGQGAEDFTDFNYWRQELLEPGEFSASESDVGSELNQEGDVTDADDSLPSEDEGMEGYDEEDEEGTEDLERSYMSKDSLDDDAYGMESLIIGRSDVARNNFRTEETKDADKRPLGFVDDKGDENDNGDGDDDDKKSQSLDHSSRSLEEIPDSTATQEDSSPQTDKSGRMTTMKLGPLSSSILPHLPKPSLPRLGADKVRSRHAS